MTPENGKNDTQFAEKIQNNRLPVGLDFVPGDFFVGIVMLHECTNFYTCTWNAARGALRWKCIGGAIEPFLPHPLLKHISDVNFRQFWCVCKVSWLSSMFRPSKLRLSLENIIIIIIIINKADSIGSSHHRCSVPNNKQSRFKRVLTPSVLGP